MDGSMRTCRAAAGSIEACGGHPVVRSTLARLVHGAVLRFRGLCLS